MPKFLFIEDSDHGWLRVPRAELERLGIADKITGYSCQDRNFVYLEEDRDMMTFCDAAGLQGWGDFDRVYEEKSFVRGLPSYRPGA